MPFFDPQPNQGRGHVYKFPKRYFVCQRAESRLLTRPLINRRCPERRGPPALLEKTLTKKCGSVVGSDGSIFREIPQQLVVDESEVDRMTRRGKVIYIYIYICSRPWTPPPPPPHPPPPVGVGWVGGGVVVGWWGGGVVVGWLGGWANPPPPPVGGGLGGGVVGWWGGGVVGWLGGWVVGWLGGWVVGWLGGWGVVRSWFGLGGLV